MVRKLLLSLALLVLPSAAQAACVSPIAGLDATSTSRTFLTVLDGSSNCIGTFVLVDGTAGANKQAVKAASTAAVATDPAAVVAISPNNTVAVTQSGTWTVQPGNTANTTPWLMTINQNSTSALVKAGNTAGAADNALVVSDPNVLAAVQAPPALGTSGGYTPKLLNGLTNTKTAVKASAGWLGMVYCYNPNAAVTYIQIYDTVIASITVGTTVPVLSLGIPPGLSSGLTQSLVGYQFSNAINVAATTTATGASAPAGAIDCNVGYN